MNAVAKSLVFALLATLTATGCAVAPESTESTESTEGAGGAAPGEAVGEGAEALAATDVLLAGQSLGANQTLVSANGRYKAIMRATDGRLVVYDNGPSTPVGIWSAPAFTPGAVATMQADGNFVIYTGTSPLWATNTNGPLGAYFLRMENDGGLALRTGSPTNPGLVRWRSDGLNVWGIPNFGSVSTSFNADESALGSWDNLIWGLTNPTAQYVTVYSAPGYFGRCQEVPPGASWGNLTDKVIGPARISSLRFGRTCPWANLQATLHVENDTFYQQRYRIVTPTGRGDWYEAGLLSGFLKSADLADLPYDMNVWWLGVETESDALFGWVNSTTEYFNEPLLPQDVVISRLKACQQARAVLA
jgi:hypothetical protein